MLFAVDFVSRNHASFGIRVSIGLEFRGKPVTGRVGVGYTFMSARPLTDTIRSPADMNV